MTYLWLLRGVGVAVGKMCALVRYITNCNHRKRWRFAGTVRNGIEWDVENPTIMNPTKPIYDIGSRNE